MDKVAGTLCSRNGQILVLQRPDKTWDLPKGRVSRGESLRAGAVRETFEEIGLRPQLRKDAPVQERGGNSNIWIFWADLPSGKIRLSEEHISYRWVAPEKAQSILYPPLAKIVGKLLPALEESMDLSELRDSCLDCVRKHLSQALILMQEVKQGYPHHRWIAVGHMGEAADEALKEYPKLADEIREHRLKYMKDPNYDVPIMDLIAKADKLVSEGLAEERAESCGSVAVSLLKPGTKRHEKWLAARNRARKKIQQENDMAQEILFWSDKHRPQDYQNCVLNVPADRVTRVVEALQEGETLERWRGSADCRICGERLGSTDLGGYGFKWPKLAEHYVMEHGVWTPELDRFADTLMLVEEKEEEDEEDSRVNAKHCGVFIPVPYNLAKDFPDKSMFDDSMPHLTVLYVGDLDPKSYRVLVNLVRKFAEKIKPFFCDLAMYGELLNKEKQKVAYMAPSAVNGTKLALVHGLLRRFIEDAGKEYKLAIGHEYGPNDTASLPYEMRFKPHATLAYLKPMEPYLGPKPAGSWRVHELECWGHETIRIPLGKTVAEQPTKLTREILSGKYPTAVPDAIKMDEWQDQLPGGKADKNQPTDFDPKELAMGIRVEMEHTKNARLAKEIAMDHLKEIPDYYTRLAKMEKGAGVSECAGSPPSEGDIAGEGTLPYFEVKKKLARKKLKGL